MEQALSKIFPYPTLAIQQISVAVITFTIRLTLVTFLGIHRNGEGSPAPESQAADWPLLTLASH